MSLHKIAYPHVVGPTDDESGAMPDRGEMYRDRDVAEPARDGSTTPQYSPFSDMISSQPGEHTVQPPYREGVISPVSEEDEDDPMLEGNLAEDQENEVKEFKDIGLKIYDSKDEAVAEFACDVAESVQDKVAGLQVYDSLKESHGLLFKYSRAQDVIYHMGTVSFPIDILFINERNQIKKICRNIQPGTLATFGCANVKNVLEIPGGLSDRLGIGIGYTVEYVSPERSKYLDKYAENFGYKKAYIKYSSLGSNNVSNWKDRSVFSFNRELRKNAGNLNAVTDLLKNMPIRHKTVAGFYLDGIIAESAFDSEDFIDISEEIDRISKNNNFIPVLLTKNGNSEYLKKVSKIIDLQNGTYQSLRRFETIIVDSEADQYDLGGAIEDRFSKLNYRIYADESIAKNAGIPVPNNTKKIAREILDLLDRASKKAEESKNNLNKNLEEYQNYPMNDPEKIGQTAGQYNQSIKRNIRIVKEYLLPLKESIEKLNSIKDISTTIEIIDALADAAKECASAAEEVFELVEILDSQDFLTSLEEKTRFYATRIDDMAGSIERAREYINNEILGIIVLNR